MSKTAALTLMEEIVLSVLDSSYSRERYMGHDKVADSLLPVISSPEKRQVNKNEEMYKYIASSSMAAQETNRLIHNHFSSTKVMTENYALNMTYALNHGEDLRMDMKKVDLMRSGEREAAIATCNLFYALGRSEELGWLIREYAGKYNDRHYISFFTHQVIVDRENANRFSLPILPKETPKKWSWLFSRSKKKDGNL